LAWALPLLSNREIERQGTENFFNWFERDWNSWTAICRILQAFSRNTHKLIRYLLSGSMSSFFFGPSTFSVVVRRIVIRAPLAIDLDISIRPFVAFNSEAPKSHGKCAIAFSAVLNFVQDSRCECAGFSP